MTNHVKTKEDVERFLPHGALMVRDNQPPREITSLEVVEGDRGPTLVGWAYPNKDFTVDLSNVVPQKGGWLCFSGGRRIVLRPLTEEQGRRNEEAMEVV